jgi:hypothetical protein
MTTRLFAPALAIAALTSAQAAQAQQQACIASEDIGDAVVYALPIAFDAAQNACANRLSGNGFMAKGGEAFIAQFRAGQDKAWPGAFRLLKTFMAKESGEGENAQINAMITSLPENALRPFVDGLAGQMIAEEIKGDSCAKIERGLELIAPLPTDNVGDLAAFLAEIVDLKNPPVCGAAAAVSATKK